MVIVGAVGTGSSSGSLYNLAQALYLFLEDDPLPRFSAKVIEEIPGRASSSTSLPQVTSEKSDSPLKFM